MTKEKRRIEHTATARRILKRMAKRAEEHRELVRRNYLAYASDIRDWYAEMGRWPSYQDIQLQTDMKKGKLTNLLKFAKDASDDLWHAVDAGTVWSIDLATQIARRQDDVQREAIAIVAAHPDETHQVLLARLKKELGARRWNRTKGRTTAGPRGKRHRSK